MSSYLKRRLAVFLCLLLAAPAILGAIPQAKLQAQAAATVSLNWQGVGGYVNEPEIQITTKTKGFYMGDYLYASCYGTKYEYLGMLSMNNGVKYKSKNTSVASINASTGLITPKKTGSTKITITFKKVSKTCTIKVVSKLGAVSNNYSDLRKSANTLIKVYGKKITNSNRYNAANARNMYLEKRYDAKYSNVRSDCGTETGYDSSKYTYWCKAHMPELAHAYAISDKIKDYVKSVNPIGTGSAKLFKVTGVSGTGNTVNAKLSAKVTDDGIFGIKASVSRIWDTEVVKGNTARFPLYVQDVKTGHKYYAVATVKKGKNELAIQLQSAKLKKNANYRLVGISGEEIYRDWANQGKTSFKAK